MVIPVVDRLPVIQFADWKKWWPVPAPWVWDAHRLMRYHPQRRWEHHASACGNLGKFRWDEIVTQPKERHT